MQRRFQLAVLALCAAVSGAAWAAPVLLPVSAIPIDIRPGIQTDPHVGGDIVSYSDAVAGGIRYFNFATSVNLAVPLDPAASTFCPT